MYNSFTNEFVTFVSFVYTSIFIGFLLFDYVMSYIFLYKAMKKVCPEKAVMARIPFVRFFAEPFLIGNEMWLGKYHISNIVGYELGLIFLLIISPIFGFLALIVIIFVVVMSMILEIGTKYFVIKKLLPDRDDFLYTACYIGIPYFKYVVWYLLGKEEESTEEQEVNEVV